MFHQGECIHVEIMQGCYSDKKNGTNRWDTFPCDGWMSASMKPEAGHAYVLVTTGVAAIQVPWSILVAPFVGLVFIRAKRPDQADSLDGVYSSQQHHTPIRINTTWRLNTLPVKHSWVNWEEPTTRNGRQHERNELYRGSNSRERGEKAGHWSNSRVNGSLHWGLD